MYKDIWYKINQNINLSIPIIERKGVYSEVNNVISFLNKFKNCNYFFSCGTALGLVRDGKLLDWDTDVDIDILEPTELIINNIIDNMQALGYSYQRVLKKGKRYSQIVFIKAPYHSIDFCFWYEGKKNFVNDVPETNIFKRSHPIKVYNKFKEIKIKNIFFKIPSNTESYFKLLYGEDWRTPKKYKNWLKNANDLKFDLSISRVFFKILWKFKIGRTYL
jgi:phosphorylcholine metabolism protein LicD